MSTSKKSGKKSQVKKLSPVKVKWKPRPNAKTVKDNIGFVYTVTELDTGMIYIGLKRFWFKRTRPPLKGKKRKRRDYIESDWKNYVTSNDILPDKIIANPKNYEMKIVKCCKTLTELKAYEAYLILNAYFTKDWSKYYNGNVQLRLRLR